MGGLVLLRDEFRGGDWRLMATWFVPRSLPGALLLMDYDGPIAKRRTKREQQRGRIAVCGLVRSSRGNEAQTLIRNGRSLVAPPATPGVAGRVFVFRVFGVSRGLQTVFSGLKEVDQPDTVSVEMDEAEFRKAITNPLDMENDC